MDTYRVVDGRPNPDIWYTCRCYHWTNCWVCSTQHGWWYKCAFRLSSGASVYKHDLDIVQHTALPTHNKEHTLDVFTTHRNDICLCQRWCQTVLNYRPKWHQHGQHNEQWTGHHASLTLMSLSRICYQQMSLSMHQWTAQTAMCRGTWGSPNTGHLPWRTDSKDSKTVLWSTVYFTTWQWGVQPIFSRGACRVLWQQSQQHPFWDDNYQRDM